MLILVIRFVQKLSCRQFTPLLYYILIVGGGFCWILFVRYVHKSERKTIIFFISENNNINTQYTQCNGFNGATGELIYWPKCNKLRYI